MKKKLLATSALVLLVVASYLAVPRPKKEALPQYGGSSGKLRLTIPSTSAPFPPTYSGQGPADRWIAFSFLFKVQELDAEARTRTKNFKPTFSRGAPDELLARARELGGAPVSLHLERLKGVDYGEELAGCSMINEPVPLYGLDAIRLLCPKQPSESWRLDRSVYQREPLNKGEPFLIVCQGGPQSDNFRELRVCTLTSISSQTGLLLQTSFAFADLKYWQAIMSGLYATLNSLSKQ